METEVEDRQRVLAIERYDVMHEAARPELTSIVDLAATICGTPMATINLITDTEQHQVAAVGFDAAVCSREDSMCARVLHEDSPLVVPDARLDPRFVDNPFVTGEIGNVRFYASHRLRTPDGVVIGTLCVFDEEPRTLDEQQLEALGTLAARIVDVLELSLRNRQLAISNERLSVFAGRVSHDLKTPLATLALSLGMISEQMADGEVDKATEGLLNRAIAGSERMAAMIDNVLAFATSGRGLMVEPVDLAQVMAHVVADLDGALDAVDLHVGELPVVQGDATHLRSVLQNLVENALKYRSPRRGLRIAVGAERRDGVWHVGVSDNGRGIAPADRQRVFEPLVRLDGDDAGFGIGLDTCRRVIEAHGGRMGVADGLEAGDHGGVTVWFDLPAA